jgi:hypothetical protein
MIVVRVLVSCSAGIRSRCGISPIITSEKSDLRGRAQDMDSPRMGESWHPKPRIGTDKM